MGGDVEGRAEDPRKRARKEMAQVGSEPKLHKYWLLFKTLLKPGNISII